MHKRSSLLFVLQSFFISSCHEMLRTKNDTPAQRSKHVQLFTSEKIGVLPCTHSIQNNNAQKFHVQDCLTPAPQLFNSTPTFNIPNSIFHLHAKSYWGYLPLQGISSQYQDTPATPRSNTHQTKPDEDFSKSHGPTSDCSLYPTHPVVPEFLAKEERNVD